MKKEYKMEDVLQVLSEEEPMNTLCKDMDMLFALMRYCFNDVDAISLRILKFDDETRKKYIKSLITLYPFSSAVIEKLLVGSIEDVDDTPVVEDYIELFDYSDVMLTCFRKFCNKLNEDAFIDTNETNTLVRQIKKYNEKIEKSKEQIAEIRSAKERVKAAHDEAERLEMELKTLEEEWSPQVIESKIERLTQNIEKAKKAKAEPEKKIITLEKELKKIQGTRNSQFEVKLNALSDVLKEMPKDVSEE